MPENDKPTIIWILQDNQISSNIVDFLSLLKEGIDKINVEILIPSMDAETIEHAKPLNPKTFIAKKDKRSSSYEKFCIKRDLIHDLSFPDGLKVWRTLILDDFGEGHISETHLQLPVLENVSGILLQIPTPLGSATEEEYIFYAWVALAKRTDLPIIGYEMLPLDTKWTLLASMLDGVATSSQRSYDFLTLPRHGIKGQVFKLPRNESKAIRPGTANLWGMGLNAPYHYRYEYKISKKKTILFIPHNVAMSYEYKNLVEALSIFGQDLHLMFCVGQDQVRGTHTHVEIVKTVCHALLGNFHSYSFHDITKPWEMIMADAVVACSSCYSTLIAEESGIPSIILDPYVSPSALSNLTTVNTNAELQDQIKTTIKQHHEITDITDIIYAVVNGNIKKISSE